MSKKGKICEEIAWAVNSEDERIIQALYAALEEAESYQEQLKHISILSITQNDVRDHLRTLQKALTKMNVALEKLELPFQQIIDVEYEKLYPPKNYEHALYYEVRREYLKRSSFEILTTNMHHTVESLLQNLPAEGPGSGNTRAHKYTPGISRLALRFKEILPHEKLATTEDQKFFEYVGIWLKHMMKVELKNHSRHIKNALENSLFPKEIQ
jgi:hypothetical protein